MSPASGSLERALGSIRVVVTGAVVAIFAALVAVVFAQVVSRFVFNAPLSWSEELARYLQVWLIMLGSAACLRKGLHLTVDYAVHALPAAAKRRLELFSLAVIGSFLGVVMVSGVSLMVTTASQRTPALQVPLWLVYLAVPVGGALMLLETCELARAKLSERSRDAAVPTGAP